MINFISASRDKEISNFIEFSDENNIQELLFLNFKLLTAVFQGIGLNCRSQCDQVDEKQLLNFKNFLSQELENKNFNIQQKFDQKEFNSKKESIKNFLKDKAGFFKICKAFFLNPNGRY